VVQTWNQSFYFRSASRNRGGLASGYDGDSSSVHSKISHVVDDDCVLHSGRILEIPEILRQSVNVLRRFATCLVFDREIE